jgi:hypothetical protein
MKENKHGVSSTCEVWLDKDRQCNEATIAAYPAYGGGYMALCLHHSRAHPNAVPVEELIEQGESFL